MQTDFCVATSQNLILRQGKTREKFEFENLVTVIFNFLKLNFEEGCLNIEFMCDFKGPFTSFSCVFKLQFEAHFS